MRIVRTAVVSVLVGAGILLASCADDPAATTTHPTTTTTTTIAQGAELFGFARSLDGDVLVFDPAEFRTGAEAAAAAREDGVIGADEELPNDFYIRNVDGLDERHLVVPAGTVFVLIGFDATGALTDAPVDGEVLAALLAGEGDAGELYGIVPGNLPMNLTLENDTVVGGSQAYLP